MKKPTSQQITHFLTSYAAVTFAGILNAVSMFCFLNPVHIIAGGFSGLSQSLTYVLVLFIDTTFDDLQPIVYFLMNVPLLLVALILLRGDFTFKTIWATVVATLVLGILPQDLQFSDSKLICVIFGGFMLGFSMYIASEFNGSNGGTEVIARIVNKYHPEVDISRVILACNVCVTFTGSVVTVCVVDDAQIDIILFSFMYVLISGTVMGMFKRGFNHPQKFLIVTTEYEKIGAEISRQFGRGYTSFDTENSYDGKQRKMLSVVVQYRQMHQLKQLVKQCDPHAFTMIKDVYDVFSRPTFNRSYKKK